MTTVDPAVTAPALTEAQTAYVTGLRQIADLLERRPALIPSFGALTINVCTLTQDKFMELGRLLGGTREKVFEGSYAVQRRWCGPHKVDVYVHRGEVCERVQVGDRVVPAVEARPEKVQAVYEWRCAGFESSAEAAV